jgi:hypothetical protein
MIPSLSFSEKNLENLTMVNDLKERIRSELEQVYDTYFTKEELLLKFQSELNKELLPTIMKLGVGQVSAPVDCHITSKFERIETIDIACNSGANAVKKNHVLLADAYRSGASIRIMINDPSLPMFNGTTTFSISYCRNNAGQPHYTKTALEELHKIIQNNEDACGSIVVKIANFAITGQLVIVNKKEVNYIPYIPNVEISDLFKVEFSDAPELIQELEASFSETWEDSEKVSETEIDLKDKKAIDQLVKYWENLKKEQSGSDYKT